jgi:hypothetical protein
LTLSPQASEALPADCANHRRHGLQIRVGGARPTAIMPIKKGRRSSRRPQSKNPMKQIINLFYDYLQMGTVSHIFKTYKEQKT